MSLKHLFFLLLIIAAFFVLCCISPIYKIINDHIAVFSALTAVATFMVVLVALYGESWRAKLVKPKLKLFFKEEKEEPYFDKFDGIRTHKDYENKEHLVRIPELSVKVKVQNCGKSIAKNVQGYIEKIEQYEKNGKKLEIYYGPTVLKWTGVFYEPKNIVKDSFFFLDLIRITNEDKEEIIKLNKKEEEEGFKKLLHEYNELPSKFYWNVWIEKPYERGQRLKYDLESKFALYFIIYAENCDPIKFSAILEWPSVDEWDKPNVKIRQNNKIINNDN